LRRECLLMTQSERQAVLNEPRLGRYDARG
jgi:hypothetical protein